MPHSVKKSASVKCLKFNVISTFTIQQYSKVMFYQILYLKKYLSFFQYISRTEYQAIKLSRTIKIFHCIEKKNWNKDISALHLVKPKRYYFLLQWVINLKINKSPPIIRVYFTFNKSHPVSLRNLCDTSTLRFSITNFLVWFRPSRLSYFPISSPKREQLCIRTVFLQHFV